MNTSALLTTPRGLKIAGGINEIQLRQQADEISTINDALESSGQAIRVLRSIELNLSPEGLGDMDDEALSRLDLVLGCFHSALRRKEDQTDRFLAALSNPSIHILGHPRGRIYNYRVGLNADWSRIFDVAAELNKAVEIDSYPDRQDLSIDLIRLARKAGCQISLGTDSHSPSQLAFMEFGAAAALSAGIKRDRILNFMSRGSSAGLGSQSPVSNLALTRGRVPVCPLPCIDSCGGRCRQEHARCSARRRRGAEKAELVTTQQGLRRARDN
jgi:histidinol phosphatase-like PHP family hydrolase